MFFPTLLRKCFMNKVICLVITVLFISAPSAYADGRSTMQVREEAMINGFRQCVDNKTAISSCAAHFGISETWLIANNYGVLQQQKPTPRRKWAIVKKGSLAYECVRHNDYYVIRFDQYGLGINECDRLPKR